MTAFSIMEHLAEYHVGLDGDYEPTFECIDCGREFDEEDDLTFGFCSKCLKKSYTETNFRKFIEDNNLAADYKEFLDGESETHELLNLYCTDDLSYYWEWLAKQS